MTEDDRAASRDNLVLFDAIDAARERQTGTEDDAVDALMLVLAGVSNVPGDVARRWVQAFLQTTHDPLAIAGAAKLLFDAQTYTIERSRRQERSKRAIMNQEAACPDTEPRS
jgi:hypothetical protein